MRRSLNVAIAVIACCTLVACTSFRTAYWVADSGVPFNPVSKIEPGEVVRIHLAGDKTRQFTVTSVTEKAIYGRSESVPVEQIESIELAEYDATRTVLLIFVGITVAAILVGAAIADDFDEPLYQQ